MRVYVLPDPMVAWPIACATQAEGYHDWVIRHHRVGQAIGQWCWPVACRTTGPIGGGLWPVRPNGSGLWPVGPNGGGLWPARPNGGGRIDDGLDDMDRLGGQLFGTLRQRLHRRPCGLYS